MQHFHRIASSIVGCSVILLMMASCGVTGGPGLAKSGSTPPAASTLSTPPGAPTATGTLSPSEPATALPAPETVTISLDKPQYSTTEAIVVSIQNRLSTAIVAPDHQTDCTIVNLQQQFGGGWRMANPCRVMTATRLVVVSAGSATRVQLSPGSGQPVSPRWAPGIYRIALSYGPANIETYRVLVYSAVFTIS